MEPIVSALEELDTTLTLLKVGELLINTLLIFVLLFLFTQLFSLSVYYALFVVVLYFLVALYFLFSKNRYSLVEHKVKDLNEKLSTVADNVSKVNPLVDSLKEDVLKGIGFIRIGEFINYESVALKILALTLISVLVLVVSFFNVNFDFALGNLTFSGVVPEVGKAVTHVSDINLSYKEGNLSSLLGNRSIAQLGVEELSFSLHPLYSSTDLSKIGENSKEEFNAPVFPKEIYTSYELAYNEKINKEHQNVVKGYFQTIAG